MWDRDHWIETNCPKEEKFDRGFVKYLMKQAYEEGMAKQARIRVQQEREDRYGPDI